MLDEAAKLKGLIILVKGGGEMATGVAHRLARSGFRVCLTEIPEPQAVRREVAFCEAVFEGKKEVEGLVAKRVLGRAEILRAWERREVPLIVDPEGAIRGELNPDVVVDAILAKRNTGTRIEDAPLVIGLGPGFRVGESVHSVIETNRGHPLGKVFQEGEADPDTGIPGEIGGYTWERVLRAPVQGRFRGRKIIGDRVEKDEVVEEVEGAPSRGEPRVRPRVVVRREVGQAHLPRDDGQHLDEQQRAVHPAAAGLPASFLGGIRCRGRVCHSCLGVRGVLRDVRLEGDGASRAAEMVQPFASRHPPFIQQQTRGAVPVRKVPRALCVCS